MPILTSIRSYFYATRPSFPLPTFDFCAHVFSPLPGPYYPRRTRWCSKRWIGSTCDEKHGFAAAGFGKSAV